MNARPSNVSRRWVAIAVGVVAAGCVAGLGWRAYVNRPFHSKVGWRAQDVFSDPKVVALCQAIERNDLAAMRAAIASGADVNARGQGNMTPLLWAFPDNHPERFELLLQHGADPNVVIDFVPGRAGKVIRSGTCVTELAGGSMFEKPFLLVMEYGGNPNFVNRVTKKPLLITVIVGSGAYGADRVRTMIKRGVDLNVRDPGGIPATHRAFSWGNQFDLVIEMLESGADIDSYYEPDNTKLIHKCILRHCTLGKRLCGT